MAPFGNAGPTPGQALATTRREGLVSAHLRVSDLTVHVLKLAKPGSPRSCLPVKPHNHCIEPGSKMAHLASGSGECCIGTAADQPLEQSRKRRRTEKSRVGAAYSRKRAVAACRLCRARKIKCNNARPSCGGCMSSGSICVYQDSQDHSA